MQLHSFGLYLFEVLLPACFEQRMLCRRLDRVSLCIGVDWSAF